MSTDMQDAIAIMVAAILGVSYGLSGLIAAAVIAALLLSTRP